MKRKVILALGATLAVCAAVVLIVSLVSGREGKEPEPVNTAPVETKTQETTEATPEVTREETENEIYYKVAQGQVTPYLTNPDSAVYPEDPAAWEVRVEEGLVQVRGTVEAKNSSGETVKSSFVVQLTDGIRSYLEIDGLSEGEKQELGLQTPVSEEEEPPVSESQAIE